MASDQEGVGKVKRRIVFIAMHISPPRTGGEKYDSYLLAGAERAGFDVEAVGLTDSPVDLWLNTHRVVWRFRRAFNFLQLIRLLWQHRKQTVMLNIWLAPLLWPAIFLLRKPYYVVAHHLCGDLKNDETAGKWRGFCEGRVLAGATQILTISLSSQKQINVHTGGRIPVGIVKPGFQPVEGITEGGGDVLRILYVGHITRAKGVTELVKAAAKLPAQEAWLLEMVGRNDVEPETTERIRSVCRQAGIEDRVTLHGRIGDDELLNLYTSADIFVLPSYWEGYGIVLLEAMAHRLTVVSTTAGSIPEVVADGETGLLVPPGDVDALHAAIERLMQDGVLREALAARGLAFARCHHDWEGTAEMCSHWWKGLAIAQDDDAVQG